MLLSRFSMNANSPAAPDRLASVAHVWCRQTAACRGIWMTPVMEDKE
jgi:hypothetical protein